MAFTNNTPGTNPGIAGFTSETFGNEQELFYGDTPPPVTTTVTVGASTDIPKYSVVALDGSGNIKLAVEGTDTPYGVTTVGVLTGVGQTTTIDVYRAGHFSMGALNFDASYGTDAEKKAAFEGGSSPTIFVSRRKYDGTEITL